MTIQAYGLGRSPLSLWESNYVVCQGFGPNGVPVAPDRPKPASQPLPLPPPSPPANRGSRFHLPFFTLISSQPHCRGNARSACQGCPSRTIAFKITTNRRITATSATFFAFPRPNSRS